MAVSFYNLLHENMVIAVIGIADDLDAVKVELTGKPERIKFLPYGCRDSRSLLRFIKNRGIPATRYRINQDLTNGQTPFELMLENYGLSLTDHYWIKPLEERCTWEQVNLYENEFNNTFTLDLKDDIKKTAGSINYSPSATLNGDLQKKWVIDKADGKRRLVKGNYGRSCLQSLCEVLASEIHRLQGTVNYVDYKLIKLQSEGEPVIGCICDNFTDINIEFVPAVDITNEYKTPGEVSEYEAYIRFCEKNGADGERLRQFLEYQIVTDFVITNHDRHLNNFGMLRSSETGKLLRPAPIFDSGNSMFHKNTWIPSGKGLLDVEVTSFRKKETDLLRYITNRAVINPDKLPGEEFLYHLFMKDPTITERHAEALIGAYHQKIDFLRDFQNGADIYGYEYLKRF